MINIYQQYLKTISDNSSYQAQQYTFLLRSILQISCLSLLVYTEKTFPDEMENIDINNIIERFKSPSDGLPIEVIDKLLPILRSENHHSTLLLGWFEKSNIYDSPLNKLLNEFVKYRNDLGHGALDEKSLKQWEIYLPELINQSLYVFHSIIPICIENELHISLNDISFLFLTFENKIESPFILRKVQIKKGIWIINFEILALENKVEVFLNLPEDNFFSRNFSKSKDLYQLIEIDSDPHHSLYHNIPQRLTSTFVGRKNEFTQLIDWFNDDEEISCLIYGDGGYGKTTLVLEFLNQLITNEIDITTKRLPSIICYYSAKTTRWTVSGLTHITGMNPIITESLRELVKCLHPKLDKSWFTMDDVDGFIDKVKNELVKNSFNRDDVLFIIDNTETLVTNDISFNELSKIFKKISKKLGRLIITSRRREKISGEL